ncbi:hypothetical protein CC86DRAFT_419343 [Ophiobolus disseminans]|uniref:Ecp2 effector protein domain-containing protein n=1 Tax=Ophiobolus disseminans TaxID=1469910 RepID=A0A6A6ZXW2_9PLEO|nr:hypothetical protein CC86DRAFT_419343 [Ophiobolus disseminans]
MYITPPLLRLLFILLPFLSLLPPTTALPNSIDRINSPYAPLIGSCGKWTDYPTEEAYIFAYNAFCETFISPTKKNIVGANAPLQATYDLALGTRNKRGPWVLEIICQYPGSKPPEMEARCDVTSEQCKMRFGQFLDDAGIGGGLDKAYCVIENTGGDALAGGKGEKGMSGEGQVVVWGGMIDPALERQGGKGTLQRAIYKARKKRGE